MLRQSCVALSRRFLLSRKDGSEAKLQEATTGIGTVVGIRCHKDFLIRVDKWRSAQGGISRPDAIRRLAEMGVGQELMNEKSNSKYR
jgi:hypothetical protein